MGRDGMIPPIFHRVNPRTLTPVPATIIVAVVVSLLAGVLPINFLAEMTSIGTLVAFLVVSVGVMVLRRTAPDLPRGFKVPGYPVTPLLSIVGCFWIIKDLRAVTIYVFVAGPRSRCLVLHLRHPPLRAGEGSNDLRRRLRARRARARGARAGGDAGARRRRGPGRRLGRARAVGCPGRRAWTPSTRPSWQETAQAALDEARSRLPDGRARSSCTTRARRRRGLLEVAEQHDAA